MHCCDGLQRREVTKIQTLSNTPFAPVCHIVRAHSTENCFHPMTSTRPHEVYTCTNLQRHATHVPHGEYQPL
eukprot:m.33560 g.33560  ORF g.33560 m.33560 type:complete len:72 (+) comp9636_c0_seq3:3032-3247(+)